MNHFILIIINSIKLYFKIGISFLLILFKKDKRLIELYFDSGNEVLFENSFLILNYRFKNAIFYSINNKLTVENNIKIYNVNNLNEVIHFVVYGWFETKHYVIEVKPQKKINKETFITEISNLKISIIPLEFLNLTAKDVNLKSKTISINFSKVLIEKNNINIKTNSFTQNDFL